MYVYIYTLYYNTYTVYYDIYIIYIVYGMMYPLLMTNIAMEAMAHRNR